MAAIACCSRWKEQPRSSATSSSACGSVGTSSVWGSLDPPRRSTDVPTVPFAKGSACGNDFLIIGGMHAPADLPDFTRRICHRYLGVGADGVEWLFPATDADIRARLLNADGSEAEISGNGTRCVAEHLIESRGKSGASDKVTVRTGAGVKTCRLL